MPQVIQFSRQVSPWRRRRDSACVRILQKKESIKLWKMEGGRGGNSPFSRLSICSFVNEVRFLCSFLFSRSLSCESSSPEELCSELPSDVFSCRASAETKQRGIQAIRIVIEINASEGNPFLVSERNTNSFFSNGFFLATALEVFFSNQGLKTWKIRMKGRERENLTFRKGYFQKCFTRKFNYLYTRAVV